MIHIPGYHIVEEIGKSPRAVVYRGYSEKDKSDVIIKVPARPVDSSDEMLKKYEALTALGIEGIVRLYRVETFDSGSALIMEDFGGVSLKKMIVVGFRKLRAQLDIALKMTDILGRLHDRRLIHGNIKPSNVIVNHATGDVRLTDSAYSVQYLSDDTGTVDISSGSLVYISPEQTGRLNRVPDYRTDFYSLGVCLYEMLAGEPPFVSKDPIELIYSHITMVPGPLKSADARIPDAVSDMVDRLLAKNPEDRYQSAFGIRHDLERFLAMLDENDRIDRFTLAEKDVSEWLNIPRKVYGRKKEKAALNEAFERIARGGCEAVLVRGSAGVGKTSLVQEAFRPIVFKGAFFAEGKFDRLKQDIPYSAIIQSFRGLIRQILTETRERLAEWKACIQDAFGNNGQIILDVIPEIEFIVGPQPPLPKFGPAETKNVFNMVFHSFFKVFTRRENPLVMFLDDLQYADMASLQLIETVLGSVDSGFFMLVCAYRGDEVGDDHPFCSMMTGLEKSGVRSTVIQVEPLGFDEIRAMTSDMFSGAMADSRPLAELILKKTNGNPFFINEFISKVYRENLIRFDSKYGAWGWDLDKIERMGVTDNIIDLLIERLRSQPEGVRETLALASCIGNTFHTRLLAEIRNASVSETMRSLQSAVREGFLLPVRDISEIETPPEESAVFMFLHDRIQEASQALLGPVDEREVHLSIGRTLRNRNEAGDIDDVIFEVLFHLGKGIDLMTDEAEKLGVASLCLSAGRKASAATAYFQACSFLGTGLAALPGNAWEEHYQLTFDLHRELSDCQYLAGNFEESERLFLVVTERSRTDIDRGEISAARVALFTNSGKFAEAQETGLRALKMLGLSIDATPEKLPAQIEAEIKKVQDALKGKTTDDLLDLPAMQDPLIIIQMKLLIELTVPTYVSNQMLHPLIDLKMLGLSLQYGNSPESPYGYMAYSRFTCKFLMRYEEGFEFGKMAIRLHEKIGRRSFDCKIYFLFACFINHWKQHAVSGIPILEKAYQLGREYGDIYFSSFATNISLINQLILGHRRLDSLREGCEASIVFLQTVKNVAWHARQRLTRQVVLSLMGQTDGRGSFTSADYNEYDELQKMRSIKFMTGVVHYYLCKAKTLYLFGKFDEARAAIDESERMSEFHNSTLIATDHYLYHSLILSAQYPSLAAEDKERSAGLIARNRDLFEKWSRSCPENFECRYLLILAEIDRIAGKTLSAMDLYDRAILSAEMNSHPLIGANANELLAGLLLSCGMVTMAGMCLKGALETYRSWGAAEKVNELVERFPAIASGDRAEAAAGEAGRERAQQVERGASVADLIDLNSIIKSSRVISGEIQFKGLVDKLMCILLENAGALRGFLVIDERGGIIVDAKHEPDGISVSVGSADDLSAHMYPESVINYVKRTGESVVLNDAVSEGMFITDPYIAGSGPKSILCMPIIEQQKFAAILYLENNMLKNVFTPARVEFLRLLSSQAAISVRNSLNYEEIRQTKEKLQESLDEYLNLFNNIQDTFYRTDTAGRLVLLSPSAVKLLGRPLDEIVGRNLADFFRYPEQNIGILARLEIESSIEGFEVELIRKDGSLVWVSANSHYYRDHQGNILGVEGVMRDITLRKQAEEMLLDEKERLSVMLKSIGDGVIATDTNCRVVLVNKVAEELTGWSQAAAVGRDLGDVFNIVDEQSGERCPNPIESVLSGMITSLTGNIILVSRDGMQRIIANSAAPIRDKYSRIVGAIIVFRDITEKRKLETEILKSQKLESLGLFAGGIAHDFNNFLMGIVGNISLAKLYARDDSEIFSKLDEAEKASLRARDLTQQLLTFSRGGSPVRKTAHIAGLIRESAQFVLSGSNIGIEFDIPDDVWPVEVDEGQINQVMSNLIINAMQAMPRGGKIVITVKNVNVRPESPLPVDSGRYVHISVVDQGIGIPSGNMSKIFDPFFTTKVNGNGLGLSTSYSIVKKHDGHIECESEPGRGTVFHIYLPASIHLAVQSETSGRLDEYAAVRGKVLLMDDEDMVLDVGGKMLSYLGFEVVKVKEGKEAVDTYREAISSGAPFSAVIVDLTIPGGMGGKEAVARIREIDPAVRALVSSGYSNDPVMADYAAYGFSGVIVKPYRMDELKKAMGLVLARQRG